MSAGTPNWREIFRYLGYNNGARPEGAVLEMIERAEAAVRGMAEAKSVYQRFPLVFHGDGAVEIGDIRIESAALRRNLDGCAGVFLLAATLGADVDRLITRLTALGHVSEAAAAQAAAAALIEDVCDEAGESMRKIAAARGLKLRPRFSPGYGDFSIEHQRDIARVLDTARRIGLTVTDSLMLAPMKSVTAVIGLSETTGCPDGKCEACAKTDCDFRRL